MTLSERMHLIIGTGFYSGYAKFFPGSVGTLASVPFAVVLNLYLNPYINFMFIALLTLYSCFLCWDVERILEKKDAKEIVIDEWIGFFISVFLIPVSIKNYFIAFMLFRIFDIWKPFPIKIIDEKGGRGIGVVFDDVVAGIFTLIIMNFLV